MFLADKVQATAAIWRWVPHIRECVQQFRDPNVDHHFVQLCIALAEATANVRLEVESAKAERESYVRDGRLQEADLFRNESI